MNQALEKALDRFLPRQGTPPRLLAAMRYTLSNAGKRIRPRLVLEVCRQLGGAQKNAMPAACAVEYIHTYSLIHDDLPSMDNDDVRRGKPSSHKRFGEATAIVAGDALQAAAFGAIARTPDLRLVPAMITALAEGSGAPGMCGGQVLDFIPKADLNRIHTLKTAALFSTATKLGALAARSKRDSDLARYGRHLGLAFQIIDDILDISETGTRNYARRFGRKKAKMGAERHGATALSAIRFMGKRGDRLRQIVEFVLSRHS